LFRITLLAYFISFTLKWTRILEPSFHPILKSSFNFKIEWNWNWIKKGGWLRNFHIWCSDVKSLKIAVETMVEYDASQFHPRSLKCVLSLDGKQAQAVCALYSLSGKTKVNNIWQLLSIFSKHLTWSLRKARKHKVTTTTSSTRCFINRNQPKCNHSIYNYMRLVVVCDWIWEHLQLQNQISTILVILTTMM